VPLIIGDNIYKLYPLDVLLAASFVGTIIFLLKRENNWLQYQKSDWLLYTFWLFVTGIFVVSLVWLTDVTGALAFSTFKQYVFYPLLIVFLPLMLRTWGDVLWFLKTLLMATVGVGAFLALGILLGGGLWTEYTPLTTSGVRLLAFPHGFYAALAFIIIILIFASDTLLKHYKKEWFYLAGGLFSLAVLASLMRHIWLSLGIVLAMVIVLTYKQGLGKKVLRYFFINALPVGTLFATLWFGVSLFPDSGAALRSEKVVSVVSDRISSIGNQYDESLVWRKAVWQSAFKEFAASPVVGIGFVNRCR
jgi:O-antigen ligase